MPSAAVVEVDLLPVTGKHIILTQAIVEAMRVS